MTAPFRTTKRKIRAARKEAWDINAKINAGTYNPNPTKRLPYVKPPTEDISRAEAQKRAVSIFGLRAFARKHGVHAPPYNCAIGIRKTVPPFRVVTIGSGKTWREATEDAIKFVEKFPEIL
jgi:hypothetical protein